MHDRQMYKHCTNKTSAGYNILNFVVRESIYRIVAQIWYWLFIFLCLCSQSLLNYLAIFLVFMRTRRRVFQKSVDTSPGELLVPDSIILSWSVLQHWHGLLDIFTYLTLSTFSFEFNESRLSDTRCCITTHCGDKRKGRRCTKRSLPNYLVMTSCHWNVRENTVAWHDWMNDKITWRHARNLVSLRILYKFYFNPFNFFKIRFYWNVR